MERRESYDDIIDALCMTDDAYGKKVLEDVPSCEATLRAIMENANIALTRVETNKHIDFSLINRHSVIQDVVAYAHKAVYDIELQKDSRGAALGRLLFYGAADIIDSLDPSAPYTNVPDVYVMLFMEHNTVRNGKAVHIEDIGQAGNGESLHIVYVDLDYEGEGEVGDIIHDIKCINPNHIRNPILRSRSLYLKTTKEGRREMSPILQKLWDEGKEESRNEIALSLLSDGMSLEKVAYHTKLPIDILRGIKASLGDVV